VTGTELSAVEAQRYASYGPHVIRV